MRFQQLTGPMTAKGYEDTAFYRYNRLVSLNEVGGEPSRFGTTLAEFHAANVERARHAPFALSATATHDTKRGEDTRVRIDVLSEMPYEWRAARPPLAAPQSPASVTVDGRPAPTPNEEYLLYQTMVGAWPIDAGRLRDYMLKTAREAKETTSWTNPNPRGDDALARFVDTLLDARTSAEFLRRLRGVSREDRFLRHPQFAGTDLDQDHRTRGAGLLPGHRALGPEPGGSRQPTPGGLGAAPTTARRA